MKLAELQKEFARHLYDSKQTRIFEKINEDAIPVTKRLEIYRNNVFGNFDYALELIYPQIKKIIDEELFKKLTREYHQKFRSQSGNLDNYGKYFFKLLSKHRLPFLKDLAKLEWLYHLTYFSRDIAGIDLVKLQNLKPEEYYEVKFKLHPSCYLLASKYPIYNIWKNNKQSNLSHNLTRSLSHQGLLIERAQGECKIHNLTSDELIFLKEVKAKKNIYQIYEILTKNNSESDIGLMINKFIPIGILADFYL